LAEELAQGMLPCLLPLASCTGSQVEKKGAALKSFQNLYVPPGVPPPMPDDEPLLVKSVYKHIQVRGAHKLAYLAT
jgi:hypothetical protein